MFLKRPLLGKVLHPSPCQICFIQLMRILDSRLSFEPPFHKSLLISFVTIDLFALLSAISWLDIGHWFSLLVPFFPLSNECLFFNLVRQGFIIHLYACAYIVGHQMPSLFKYLQSYCLPSFLTYGTFLC